VVPSPAVSRRHARTHAVITWHLAKTRFGVELVRNWLIDPRYGATWARDPDAVRRRGRARLLRQDYLQLSRIFAAIPIAPDDVLVDVGCGLGRVINHCSTSA